MITYGLYFCRCLTQCIVTNTVGIHTVGTWLRLISHIAGALEFVW